MFDFINNNLLNIQSLAGVGTILGLYFAFWQYKKNSFERQKQILISLNNQLSISGLWAGAEGYPEEPSEDKKLNFSDPFYIIFEIENFALKEVMVQRGGVDFSKTFHNSLSQYNQHISRIRDLEKFREQLCINNFDSAIIIVDKLKEERNKLKSEQSYTEFIKSFDENKNDEKLARFLADKFYGYSYNIHYKIIGSRNSGGLNNFHHILLGEIIGHEKKIKKQVKIYNIIFSIFLLPIILALISLFGWRLTDMEQILIVFLIIIILWLLIDNRNKI